LSHSKKALVCTGTLLVLIFVGGCSSVATRAPVVDTDEPPDPMVSLFAGDAAVLSDADIQRILKTQVPVPDRLRIGLLYTGHRTVTDAYGHWYSRDHAETRDRDLVLFDASVAKLYQDDRVHDVAYLPTFLMPRKTTVGRVREAAARYQADWVLIFATTTRPSGRQRLFGAEKARATCLAECAVLDVRTGVILFTSRARQMLEIVESDEDWSLQETTFRAERLAMAAAMEENVGRLLDYLAQRES
jgi:hypothetical protein